MGRLLWVMKSTYQGTSYIEGEAFQEDCDEINAAAYVCARPGFVTDGL
jgi:hypothetical protein